MVVRGGGGSGVERNVCNAIISYFNLVLLAHFDTLFSSAMSSLIYQREWGDAMFKEI